MGVTVLHADIMDALERTNWGEKRRAGAKKGAVKRASLKQTTKGLELDAPNGVHTIPILLGGWTDEVFFDGSSLASVSRWLKAYDGAEDTVEIARSASEIVFSIGTARRRIEAFSPPVQAPALDRPLQYQPQTKKPPALTASRQPLPPGPREVAAPMPVVEQTTKLPSDWDIQLQASKEIEAAYPELSTRHDHSKAYFMPMYCLLILLFFYQGAMEATESVLVATLATVALGAGGLWALQWERHRKYDRLLKERVYQLKNSVEARGRKGPTDRAEPS